MSRARKPPSRSPGRSGPADRSGVLTLASGVNVAGRPFAHVLLDGQLIVQLDVERCRQLGASALECAEAAEHDAMVAAWLQDKMGVPLEGAAEIIADLRQYRSDTTASTVTPDQAVRAGGAEEGAVRGDGIWYHSSRARPGVLDPPRPGAHVWAVMTTHVISEEAAAAAHRGERVNLDAENLAMVATGCFVCEEPYSPELSTRPCPGDPS